LGVAASLFRALRSKHAPTAAHSLRVALACSAWALELELDAQERDHLEIAALLHDVGKIGVPDCILLKPGKLGPDELALMDRRELAGLDILRSCCSVPEIVEIVRLCHAWFDGSRPGQALSGREIPLGARMLSIVDAFDSMTTDQVYRPALSRERALNELFGCAGTQFDADLVKLFGQQTDNEQLDERVTRRWLRELDPELANSLWHLQLLQGPANELVPETLFQHKLLENMHDAVVFVDSSLHIVLWNRGAELMTGISSSSVYQRAWRPSLLGMLEERGKQFADDQCTVLNAVKTGIQSLRRFSIAGRNGRTVAVDVHAVPVVGPDGTTHGAAIVLHDASPEASLEKRCQSLHERATKDPLTQVANRAEFERAHQTFVGAHLERRLPCALIICDIDFFKQVNDTFGHQAGDEALKSFAQLLKSKCRSGDLVARYGGEEFVVLCADCNNATAARRAEEMRRTIGELPQSSLSGKPITVSFGVTEVQAGDTPETMLRRADRALLIAKNRGRNTVVQLGTGIAEDEVQPKRRFWFQKRAPAELLLEKCLVTAVPLGVAIEKLRGFIADHAADVESTEGDRVLLTIDGESGTLVRRRSDRPVVFQVELRFSEEALESRAGKAGGRVLRTKIYVKIRPKRGRDRRHSDLVERSRHIMAGIKSYLMAVEDTPPPDDTPRRRASDPPPPRTPKRDA